MSEFERYGLQAIGIDQAEDFNKAYLALCADEMGDHIDGPLNAVAEKILRLKETHAKILADCHSAKHEPLYQKVVDLVLESSYLPIKRSEYVQNGESVSVLEWVG